MFSKSNNPTIPQLRAALIINALETEMVLVKAENAEATPTLENKYKDLLDEHGKLLAVHKLAIYQRELAWVGNDPWGFTYPGKDPLLTVGVMGIKVRVDIVAKELQEEIEKDAPGLIKNRL